MEKILVQKGMCYITSKSEIIKKKIGLRPFELEEKYVPVKIVKHANQAACTSSSPIEGLPPDSSALSI